MFMTIRHGERADFLPKPVPIKRKNDPHLTPKGQLQAKTTGNFLRAFISQHVPPPAEIHVYCSPFLRVLMTAREIVKQIGLQNIHGHCIKVHNALCETLEEYMYYEDPLPSLTIHEQGKAAVEEALGGTPLSLECLKEFGTPKYPEPDAGARLGEMFKLFWDKHFSKKGGQKQVVICVSHGISLDGFARTFYDECYTGSIPYCGISAVQAKFSKTGEAVDYEYLLRASDEHLGKL